jgi:hypothetical protein
MPGDMGRCGGTCCSFRAATPSLIPDVEERTQGLPRAQIKLPEMYAGEPEMPESAARACGRILLAIASLRGDHPQTAQ